MKNNMIKETDLGPFKITLETQLDEDVNNPFDEDEGLGQIFLADSQGEADDLVDAHGQNPLALRVQKYEHGNRIWSINTGRPNEGYHCFDTSPFVGFWIPYEDAAIEYERLLAAEGPDQAMAYLVERGNEMLKVYGYWANGECYGYIVKVKDDAGRELEDEATWGYYGEEDAIAQGTVTYDEFVTAYQARVKSDNDQLDYYYSLVLNAEADAETPDERPPMRRFLIVYQNTLGVEDTAVFTFDTRLEMDTFINGRKIYAETGTEPGDCKWRLESVHDVMLCRQLKFEFCFELVDEGVKR